MSGTNAARTLLIASALLGVPGSKLAAQPVPEFLGIYAVAHGKLAELKPLRNSGYRDMAGLGADRLTGSSGIVVDDPKVYFVIYRQDAASLTSIFLEEMKQLRYIAPERLTMTPLEPVEGDVWVGTKLGYNLKVAPMKENPEMMVRAVWTAPIPPGRYGLNIDSVLYDLHIGPPQEGCVVREGSLFEGSNFRYTDCDEYFAKNPNVRRGSAKRPAQSGSPATAPPPSQSVVRAEGTLHDTQAGLMWTANDNGVKLDWEAANAHCESLSLGGYDDWRLPSLAEMVSVYVEAPGGSSSSNFGSTTIGASLSTCCVWTSTPDDKGRNLFFSLASGDSGRIMIKAIDLRLMRALCVREEK